MTTNRRRSRRSTARTQTTVQAPVAVDARPAAAGDASQFDWRQEYGYVLSDLRTLLIVSGLLFGGIIVLAFIL